MQKVKIILETDELTTVLLAAKYLGVHFATVYRWIKAGKLHPIPIAGQDYLATDEVKALKEKNKQAAEGVTPAA
ncbi:hypothetical protein ES708_28375 [subsurface metagenome]